MRASSRPQSPVASHSNSGGQYFDRRGEVTELKQALRTGLAERNSEKMRDNVKKVIMYMTLGIDMSRLFSEMVMASQLGDTVQKKMIYLYLTTYAEENADLAILAVNTLQKDTKDVDPSVRGVALRALCALQIPNLIEYLEPAIVGGLSDLNGYVRKTAVLGVLKLASASPHLVDKVKDLLFSDSDPNVLSNCISVLQELNILDSYIEKALVYSLLNRFQIFSEFGKCTVLESVVSKYHPSSEEELYDILNVLDPFLRQTSVPVSFGIIKMFLLWTMDFSTDLNKQVISRVKDPILSLLSASSTSPEMQHVILEQILILINTNVDSFSDLFSPYWKHFLIASQSDTFLISKIKLSILASLKRDEIISELKKNIFQENLVMSAVSGLVNLVSFDSISRAIELFTSACLSSHSEIIVGECLVGLKLLSLRFSHNCGLTGSFFEAVLPRVQSHARGLEALVSLLNPQVDNAPYILEDICLETIESVPEGPEKIAFKQSVLSASVNLFLERPLEMKALLQKILYMGIEESSDPHLRDQALLYFRMLQAVGPDKMKETRNTDEPSPAAISAVDYSKFNRISAHS